jgi:hypothetical protein
VEKLTVNVVDVNVAVAVFLIATIEPSLIEVDPV